MTTAPSTAEPYSRPENRDELPLRSRFLLILAPVAVVLLGFGLRLFRLNHESVGYDEAFSMLATRMPVAGMWQHLVEDFVHPPLHYFVLRGWLDVFGYDVGAARMLSVVFGGLAVALLYLLTKYLFDRRSALISSLLLAVSQLSIMFAQEARPYAQFLCLFLACWYLFIRAVHTRSIGLWCGFLCSSILLIYTHYFGLLVLGTLLLFLLLYRRQFAIPAAWWIGGAAVILLSYVPWLTSGIVEAATHSAKTFSGKNAFWGVGGSTFFTAVNFFNNGRPAGLYGSSPLWTFFAGGLLFAAPAALTFFTVRQRPARQHLVLAAMLWALPILGAIAAGAMHFQYNVRYVAFCAAPYYVLVGCGIARIKPSLLRSGLVVLLLAYTANALRANYFMPKREDFRAAGSYITRTAQPGDCAAFYPGLHIPQQWRVEWPETSLRILEQNEFNPGLSQCGRIWAICSSVSGNPWQRERARTELRALDTTHTRIDSKRFFWVDVALYSRKTP
jgi:4-amino-4-deoxy-L-arabinose transferase-like glycosyltransferase